MNKLVSKNPVQRFKQGRKIEKFQQAGKINPQQKYVGGGTKIINWLGNLVNSSNSQQRIGMNGKPIVDNYYNTQNLTIQQKPTSQQSSSPSFLVRTYSDIKRNLEEANADIYAKNKIKEQSFKENGKKNTPPSTKVTQKKNWEDEFKNNFLNNLTTEQKTYLTNAGVDYNKVGNVQSYLMNQLNTDLGGYKDDGKWGRNSINAWNQFVSKTDFTPKVQVPVSPQPISFNTTPSTPQIPNLNVNKIYNRSDIRDLIRERTGKSAYNFNGAQRKALRMVMNGTATDEDRALVQGMGIFKQGGNLLPSRNIIERFKQRKFK